MAKYTEVTKKTWGGKISESIKGVLIGLILFVVSFGVLWWNEGRTDISRIVVDAAILNATVTDTQNEGNLVSVTSILHTDETLGDPDFLNPGKYLTLTRHVEMYAWVEKSESKTEKKVGGSEETTTTYYYVKEWTSSPPDSSGFKDPNAPTNPPMKYEDETFYVSTASIGVYPVDISNMSLPGGDAVPLASTSINYRSGGRLDGNYIFVSKSWGSSADNPQVGDVRINYTALPNDVNVTAFGKLQGGSLVPYMHKGKTKIYHARYGTVEEAMATLHKEHQTTAWIFRIVGFLMMWIGLTMFFGPINAVLDVLPFLGNVSRTIIGFVMFIVALVLSGITILISMIAHNIIALIITLVIIIGGVLLFSLLKKKKGGAKAAA